MTSHPTIQWRKSSYSNGMGGECVEVAVLTTAVAVRDSKVPLGLRITFNARAWGHFMGAVCAEEIAVERTS
ncbi:DUF397 domain-containing protein [Streptomyces sp. NPDC058644]|uniref:DUF397 domain-containing protein n=1 Tax=unclassified Streptomyces TaxID=2593676 RepID=UPI00365456BF